MKKKILLLLIACLFAISNVAGQTFASPEFVGSWRTPFTKSLSLNVEGRPINNYYYSFTLTNSMDITVSHCGSRTTSSGIFIMDENENMLASDGGFGGNCSTPGLAKVTVGLSAGTYIIWIDWSPTESHHMTTEITGEYPNVRRIAQDLGTHDEAFSYARTIDTSDPNDTYQIPGSYQDGVCYGFTTTRYMDITVSHCGSEVSDTYLYFLGNQGGNLDYNDNYDGIDACYEPRQAYLVMPNLAPGTYYVVSKGAYANGNITTRITGEIAKDIPSIEGFAEDIGEISTFLNFTDTKNTWFSGYPGYGDYRAGISYALYLLYDMDITISHCGSGIEDTRIYLLDVNGEVLHENDDYTGINSCENTKHAYLDVHLSAGIYYVVSTGAHQRGSLTTQIIGRTTEIELGSEDKNYIITRTYKDASGYTWLDKLDYFDAMGRIEQNVLAESSPQRGDIVTAHEYDSFGRKKRAWLPGEITNNTRGYTELIDMFSKVEIANGDDIAPYSEIEYELSPLDRPVKQYGPGDDWQYRQKAVETKYQLTNGVEFGTQNCQYYVLTEKVENGETLMAIRNDGIYAAGFLNVVRSIGEDENMTIEFKNCFGQVILSRQISNDEGKPYDTYYVYDKWDNLRAVLPPTAADMMKKVDFSWSESDEVIRNYAYLYKYDERFRVITKRLPGQDWTRYVYDKADAPIFAQDGEQRKRGEWSFSITDGLGRVCLTGICKNRFSSSAASISTVVNAVRDNTISIYKGYSISGITLVDPQVMMVYYYDDYEFLGKNGVPSSTDNNYRYEAISNYDHLYKEGSKSLLTGTLTAQLNDSQTISYLPSVMYYDYRGRLIQSKTGTHLTGGVEKEYVAYDFMDNPVSRVHTHIASGKSTQKEEYAYAYDHAGRLLTSKYKQNGRPAITLTDNEYDGIGRLKANKRNGNIKLKTSYSYNVRSWTKSISNPLFSQTLYYNDKRENESNTVRYNGNISAIDWTTSSDSIQRGYDFAYDGLSRLLNARYLEDDIRSDKFNTSYSYDKQGNLLTLSRRGLTASGEYGLLDDLSFTLEGNQLKTVNDVATDSAYNNGFEFKDKTKLNEEYFYDTNGNLTQDLNKNIIDIQYNILNLPCRIEFGDGSYISYLYDATGTKLRVVHCIAGNTTTTDYCGNVIYENGSPKTSLTEAGFVSLNDGKYHFYLQDHQGNIRMVADQNGAVEETNHYYPFGGVFANSTSIQTYKYNGKELDTSNGLEWYDYGARHYDAALGRWHVVDPLGEKYYGITPYAYCNNDPIKNIDLDGRDWYLYGATGQLYYNRDQNQNQITFNNSVYTRVGSNNMLGDMNDVVEKSFSFEESASMAQTNGYNINPIQQIQSEVSREQPYDTGKNGVSITTGNIDIVNEKYGIFAKDKDKVVGVKTENLFKEPLDASGTIDILLTGGKNTNYIERNYVTYEKSKTEDKVYNIIGRIFEIMSTVTAGKHDYRTVNVYNNWNAYSKATQGIGRMLDYKK